MESSGNSFETHRNSPRFESSRRRCCRRCTAWPGADPRGNDIEIYWVTPCYTELHQVTPSYTELHRVTPESPKFSSSIPSSVGQRSFYMFYCNSANVKIQADPYFSMPLFHTFLPFQAINLFQHVNPRIQRCGDVAMSRAACAMRLLHTCRTITAKRAKEL